MTGESAVALPLFNGQWDLIHFDHFKECYLPDLRLLLTLNQLHAGTVCVFHDSNSFASCYMGEIREHFTSRRSLVVDQGAEILWGVKLKDVR